MFGLIVTPEQATIVVLGALSAALGAGYLFRRDTAQEERRRGYIALSCALKDLGLTRLAAAAANLAIDDKSGLWAEGKALAQELSNPEKVMELLSESFFKQLPQRLKRPGDREKIQAVVDAQKAVEKVETQRPRV